MLRGILLIARPPLLAVMQGGEYARFQFVHISYDRRQSSNLRDRRRSQTAATVSLTKDEFRSENLHVSAEGCQLSIIIGGQKGDLCETSLPWHCLFWYRSRLSPRQWPNRPNRPNALQLIGRNRRRKYSSTTGRWYRSTRRMGTRRRLLNI